MRFVFPSSTEQESEERQRLLTEIDATLAALAELLRQDTGEDDLRARARALLGRLDARLELEIVHERDESRTLAITPRGERHLRPMVDAIVARAPAVPGWRFVTHRPQRSFDDALALVADEYGYDLSSGRARAGFSRGHLLDIVIYASGFGGNRDERALSAAELLVEALLGERIFDDWVGQVSAEPAPKSGPLRVVSTDAAPHFPLQDLPAAVAAAIEGLRSGLPAPASAGIDGEGWTLFEIEPEAASDYAGQDDVALVSSALPEMMKCHLEGAQFSSLRFARGGERFAYLKLDVRDEPFDRRLALRTALEERLLTALGQHRLGAVVGSGLGVRYSYVNLALRPELEAYDLACRVARDFGAPLRSWLLFCDTDLGDEWLGVWTESPEPPRRC